MTSHGGNAIEIVAAELKAADFLLVAAGAGFSADSGLPLYCDVAAHPIYQQLGLTYQDLALPRLFVENAGLFFGFWGDCLARYRATVCHEGYSLLEKWVSALPARQSYVYTSNVDGHFRRWPGLRRQLHEIHGCLEEWMCSSSLGLFCCDGEVVPRGGDFWPAYQDAVAARGKAWLRNVPHAGTLGSHCASVQATAPESFAFKVDPKTMLAQLSDDDSASITEAKLQLSDDTTVSWGCWPPCCLQCGSSLRPAVLLFDDLDAVLTVALEASGAKYQEWESEMETAVADGARLVILELGCGLRVPSVRVECEAVLRDTVARGGHAKLVRINPDFPENESCPEHTISIGDSALNALMRIDAAMTRFFEPS